MQNLFRKHPDVVLIGLAIIFLGMLLAYIFWGITALVLVLDKGVNPGKAEVGEVEFDLKGAAALDLRGLVR